jgi:hypothetical protein
LKQPEQVEFTFHADLVEHFLGWEVVNLNDDVGAQVAKPSWQMPENLAGEDFELD